MATKPVPHFETFIEAGAHLKKNNPDNAKLQGVDVESLGIQWYTAEPDALKVTEASPERGDRAPWPYQPDEGFNILKTMGNLPYSGLKLASDVGQAILSPIDTGVGLARGAAGALESGLVPSGAYTMEEGVKTPLSISPENVEVWQNIKEGLKESVSPRGLQERPLDAASNVLTTTGLLAKVGKVGARAASAAAKGQVPKRIADISERAVETGQRIADFTGRADPGRRVTGALDKTGDIFETVEKATQRYDPANIMMRGGVEVLKEVGGAGVRYAGRKVKGAKVYQTGKKAVDQLNEFLEGGRVGEWVKNRLAQTEAATPTDLTRLREWWDHLEGKSPIDKGVQAVWKGEGRQRERVFVFGEDARHPSLMTESGGGVLGGLLEETLGFTFGLGPKLVRELRDISMKGDAQRALVLETIRHADDATVHRHLANDLRGAVKQYAETQSEIHRKMRAPLQLDRVMVDVAPLRQILREGLPRDVNIDVMGLEGTKFGPFFTDAGQGAIGNMLDAIFDESLGNKISLQQIDNFKQLISEVLYEGGLSPEGRAAGVLREMRGATSDYIKAIADDPAKMNAALLDIRNADAAKLLRAQALTGGGMTAMVPPRWLQQITDEALGEFMPVGVGEYSAAMRQYFNFQDNMDDLRSNLGLERPQTRTFTTGEIDPQTGRPITEEILRQKKSDIETLRNVFSTFGDDTGLALETLKTLAKETNRPELISQTVGAMFRPTFGGGLIVRAEISQAGRSAVGGLAHPLAMVTTLINLPIALGLFSPKYGGQVYAAIFSPEGQKFLQTTWKKYGAKNIDRIKAEVPDYYRRVRQRVADAKNKRAEKVTDAEVIQGFEDMEQAAGELAKLDQTQITALRDFLRYGTAEQRTRGAGQRREERQNLLQQLGRLPQTPSVSPGGLTPQAR